MKIIYFDNAATTKLDEKVLDKMLPFLKENYGNASSLYKLGKYSREIIEKCRYEISQIFNCDMKEIYFTSGGSESNNMAIKGIAYANKNKGNHIITSKIEHPSVLNTCRELEKDGFIVSYINVDKNGFVDLEQLEKLINDKTILISIMSANNEIGTIEPIKEISRIVKKYNLYFHTDAVQLIGDKKLNFKELNIDSLSLSAHKFYGPKGIGICYIKKGINFKSLINGGSQENKKRAGTENIANIVGMTEALKLIYKNLDEKNKKIKDYRDYLIAKIIEKIPYIKINGDLLSRLSGNVNISFRFVEGESLLLNLDNKGICVSSGSACSSQTLEPSHVLLAIGLTSEIAHGTIRISIGKYNTKEEIDYLIESFVEVIEKLRNMSPLYEEFLEEHKK